MLLRGMFSILIIALPLFLGGCGKPGAGLSQLAKKDIDMVADAHLQ
jgi:hypothetical protein